MAVQITFKFGSNDEPEKNKQKSHVCEYLAYTVATAVLISCAAIAIIKGVIPNMHPQPTTTPTIASTYSTKPTTTFNQACYDLEQEEIKLKTYSSDTENPFTRGQIQSYFSQLSRDMQKSSGWLKPNALYYIKDDDSMQNVYAYVTLKKDKTITTKTTSYGSETIVKEDLKKNKNYLLKYSENGGRIAARVDIESVTDMQIQSKVKNAAELYVKCNGPLNPNTRKRKRDLLSPTKRMIKV